MTHFAMRRDEREARLEQLSRVIDSVLAANPSLYYYQVCAGMHRCMCHCACVYVCVCVCVSMYDDVCFSFSFALSCSLSRSLSLALSRSLSRILPLPPSLFLVQYFVSQSPHKCDELSVGCHTMLHVRSWK